MTQKPTPNNMQSKCYEWLISPDVAAYCEEIGHYFDSLEMAVIAEISGRPQKERHAFWREIIDQLPDMPVVASCNFKARDSLHELLAELIALEESEAAEFFKAQQAHFNIDYLRSSRIIEQLERRGIIGSYNGLTPQKALISKRYRRMPNPSEVKPEQPKQRPDDMPNPHTLKDVFVLYEEEKAALTIHAKTIPWKIQIWMSA